MVNYSLFKEIELYAKRHMESSKKLYKSRRANTDKIFIDCLRGKIAEYECYFSMTEAGYILKNEPDLKIYSDSDKSCDADLICIGKKGLVYDKERHIHVKSISKETMQRYGASFLIEKSDPIVSNPKDNHYFCIMEQKSLSYYTFYKWVNSHDIEWKNPILNFPTKLAAYL